VTLGVIADITERKRAEAELAAQKAELERSNSELEQFAYIASHDLQEPLRMVASYTELLGQRYEGALDERADKYIHYAVDGARRMQRLVDDLLQYSRVGTQGKVLKPTDTDRIIDDILEGMREALATARARVSRDELPVVLADGVQLGQVFQNLMGNAVKFRSVASPEIRVGCRELAFEWEFSVADNGIGIEPEQSDRVFQMFQRLHARGEYEGSGIGLAIVKKIVDRHGGRVWFESAPGEGTTFFFTLPKEKSSA
jgi:light-regulated signal transduction histidine kinase (bacteriophytochrome)